MRIIDLKSKRKIKSIIIEKNLRLNRINDGKTDQSGRLWFGTMDNLERNINRGSLYCVNKNLEIKKVDKNYMITNGPAFINEKTFYHTDSRKKRIYKIKVDKNLKILSKKIFKKFKIKDGSPDGMTLDNKNNLWVGHYNGACISVFNKQGKRIHKIDLPAKNITNCTFGGKNNSELFVTSALKGMKTSEIKKYKYSGSLFKIQTNAIGINQKKFSISYDKKRPIL